ncbi:MAG: class I SAM-dependent methyltransferase [SAR324 cluster bacterium]|nr:class I SAM-dependent methyltransferase [SAR324 cluster bacterium]
MAQNDELRFPATGMPDKDWWQALWPNPSQVLKEAGITPDMKVLDLCCGDGHFTAPLCELLSKGSCTALDLDEALLGETVASCRKFDNFQVLKCDAMELSSQISEPVDFVFIANTFHGIPDKPAFAQEVAKILKPGGKFAIVNWHQKPKEETLVLGVARGPKTEMRMTPDSVTAVVTPAGFKLKQIVDVGKFHYIVTYKKS